MPPEIEERHHERYRKVLTREMTLAEALAENEADWERWFLAEAVHRSELLPPVL